MRSSRAIFPAKPSQPLVIKNNKDLVLNNYTLSARKEDGYIDVTNLCKAGGKKFNGWFRVDKTKAFLQVLSEMTHIYANVLIKYQNGSNEDRRTWCHPQVAINIAQWCSPEFDVQVSKWVFELMTIGKVELGKELSCPELTDEFKMRLGGVDIRPYEKDDVLYILSFEGEGENIGHYKFGISSNISSRLLSHESDKDFPCVYARHIFRCRTRQQAMDVEKYLKRLVILMKLQLEIGTKKECFHATPEQYEVIESKVSDFLNNDGVVEEDNTELRLEMYKKDKDVDKEVALYRIEMEYKEKSIQYELFRNGLINMMELKELLILCK